MDKTNLKAAFSLAEILITLLIVSLLMIAIAPVITKKALFSKKGGVVYLYREGNNIADLPDNSADAPCFVPSVYWRVRVNEVIPARECSRYEFTVPDGVHRVDLTLVAGGGGGGGAGSQEDLTRDAIEEYTLSIANGELSKTIDAAHLENLKELKINYLTAQGRQGAAADADAHTVGGGGASSPLLYNFLYPTNRLRGINHIAALNVNEDRQARIVLNAQNGENAVVGMKFGGNDAFDSSYRINNDNGFTTNFNDVPAKNFISSKNGEDSVGINAKIDPNNEIAVGKYYKGGKGAAALQNFEYGRGGDGDSLRAISCQSSDKLACPISAANFLSEKLTNTIGDALASVTYKYEQPAIGAYGGVGGTMIKIRDFEVNPGDRYAIYVGRGGKGGTPGLLSNSRRENGDDGGQGVSSAIYRIEENGAETRVYLAIGGSGGYGGGSGAGAGSTGGRRPAYIATVYGNGAVNNTEEYSIIAGGAARKTIIGTGVEINYTFMSDDENTRNNLPYFALKQTRTSETDDRVLSGFFDYDDRISAVKQGAKILNGAYNGLYYRTVLGNTPAYVGGLGGPSGLGTKAGCGGYFMGNFDGRTTANTPTENNGWAQDRVNTFAVNIGKTANSGTFRVFDYYDNCTTSTPDGQTANFVQPEPGKSLGAAGAGGGGGGWSLTHGAGKGGDGQDGYVMIEWTK